MERICFFRTRLLAGILGIIAAILCWGNGLYLIIYFLFSSPLLSQIQNSIILFTISFFIVISCAAICFICNSIENALSGD